MKIIANPAKRAALRKGLTAAPVVVTRALATAARADCPLSGAAGAGRRDVTMLFGSAERGFDDSILPIYLWYRGGPAHPLRVPQPDTPWRPHKCPCGLDG